MSIVVASGIFLVIALIVAIPILVMVFRSAGARNPDEDEGNQERESGEQDR